MTDFTADIGMTPKMAADAASQQELTQRKLSIDALSKRLGDPSTKEKKLRESCEGFESIFLQKMWEEMRKNVNKEGYLHSKDEETYQSMFDVELAKKMTSAGGIGLADMLYEQLSQQLSDTGRTKTPTARKALPIDAAISRKEAILSQQAKGELRAEDLYSELVPEKEDISQQDSEQSLENVLQEIRADLAGVKLSTEKNEDLEDTKNTLASAEETSSLTSIPPLVPKTIEKKLAGEAGFASTSWKAQSGKISAKTKPISTSMSKRKVMAPGKSVNEVIRKKYVSNAQESNGILPSEARWPIEGQISSSFGWQNDGDGKRHWNAGVSIKGNGGESVAACMGGKVLFSGPAEGYENLIVLEHPNGYKSYYGNVTDVAITAGDILQAGTNFAKVKISSSEQEIPENSSSLFFALKRGEVAINPEVAIPRLVTASR